MQNKDIKTLIQLLSRLPGLGPRSGRRAALHLIKNKDQFLNPLRETLGIVGDSVRQCAFCGNLDTTEKCYICLDDKRDHSCVCVVAEVEDLWAMERAQVFSGTYHVLGGTLSAIDGIGPDKLAIQHLINHIKTGTIKEIIIALSATLEGQTTAHYLVDRIQDFDVQVTRIAHGMPVGGELDYLDEGTISAALKARTPL
ncbi:MAG: recombination protein RecR [Holosporaceae bacterium]|nr:MAG: recombination protein RecR [Holosporaceae bacterium]